MTIKYRSIYICASCIRNATLSDSYTMGYLPVRGDNPRALASGLSYVLVDRHGMPFYTTYNSIDLAHPSSC